MADLTEAGHAEEMGIGKRMVGVFFSPGATFESVRSRVSTSDWLVPLILLAIVVAITAYLVTPMAMEQEQAKMAQAEINMEDMQTIGMIAGTISAPVGIALIMFLISAILLVLVRFVLGGETTYKHVLAVNCLSSLICIPSAIVSIPLMLAKESVYVQVGFGLLLPDSMAETFLARLLFNLNFFSIWQYALVGIGLGIVSGISIRKAVIGVFVLLVLYAVGSAALQTMFAGLGG
ncbi:MAG: YIP1 family protein [Gemmatimonadota bacterium]|nr:YIP1 family protein [Gemmatimonadota bacterium]MYB55965.1 YIP1 family protein [Gemmatimonadota bacterium]